MKSPLRRSLAAGALLAEGCEAIDTVAHELDQGPAGADHDQRPEVGVANAAVLAGIEQQLHALRQVRVERVHVLTGVLLRIGVGGPTTAFKCLSTRIVTCTDRCPLNRVVPGISPRMKNWARKSHRLLPSLLKNSVSAVPSVSRLARSTRFSARLNKCTPLSSANAPVAIYV